MPERLRRIDIEEDFASNFAKSTGSQSSLSEEQAICIGENIYTEAGEEQITEMDGQLSESTTIPKELIAPVAKAALDVPEPATC